MNNNKLLVSALIVILFVGGLIYLSSREKMEEKITVFDSNIDPKFGHVQPFEFTLGAGQVIPGWDKGIVGMKVGEKKELVISPEEGYGPSGIPGLIPPNATLYFDVELLAINNSGERDVAQPGDTVSVNYTGYLK